MYRIPVMPVMSTIKNHRNFYQVSTSPSPTMVVAKYLPLPPAWSTWRKQLPAARRASCTEVPAETKCTTATGPWSCPRASCCASSAAEALQKRRGTKVRMLKAVR